MIETEKLPFHEFFAGSGLVSYGLRGHFKAVWANDISERKARFYRENCNPDVLQLCDVSEVSGEELPKACLSWASFPCQDLSLAGKVGGIFAERSGLVWQWMRIIDEMGEDAPRVVCLENVSGLVSARNGEDYKRLHHALSDRGYSTGAILVNARRFVPQSRPRIFVIGTRGNVPNSLFSQTQTWLQPPSVHRASKLVDDFIMWSAKEPEPMENGLIDVLEDAEFDQDQVISLIPKNHLTKFEESGLTYTAAYKRTRNHNQVLELRCDGIAGCLRTPGGGSSRQYIVKRGSDGLHARLMTAREAARLMGAPEYYKLPGTYNDGYFAMGDAVVAPVAEWLGETFLYPLVRCAYGTV